MKLTNAKAAPIFFIKLKFLPVRIDFDFLHSTGNVENHNTTYSLSQSLVCPWVRTLDLVPLLGNPYEFQVHPSFSTSLLGYASTTSNIYATSKSSYTLAIQNSRAMWNKMSPKNSTLNNLPYYL